MREILLSWIPSCMVLTAAVLLVRGLLGKRISARLRYALWIVVLARLLIPVQLFTAPAEISRTIAEAPPVTAALQALPRTERIPDIPDPHRDEPETPVQAIPSAAGGEVSVTPAARRSVGWMALFGWTWLAGAAAAGMVMLWSNLRFARRLRRLRVPLETTDCPLKVYTAKGLPSPCLFGVLRPAVYVNPETAADPVMLRHVLAHEVTHFRHGDHIWSLLRCAALAVHWWNPLVWLAARLSRQDAELACDEGALKRLGHGERRAYGNTLLALVTAKPRPGDLLCLATTMSGDKKSLRERVSRIARAPKRWLWATVLAAGLAVLVCACAFAKTVEKIEDRPLTQEELDHWNNEVFNGEGFNILNQFVFLSVEASKDYRQIDLFQLFYNGTGMPGGTGDEERQAVIDAALGGEDPEVDLVKCPAGEMDEILRKYLGLSLEDTDKVGLDQFTYLPEYDAYYHFCGDTNYIGNVTFLSGEYKDGKVLLYYQGNGYPVHSNGDGGFNAWDGFMQARLTLEPQKDGGFHFLTNWQCDLPAHPTVYPDWDPELVIPLDGLEPYQAPEIQIERRTGDVAEVLWSMRIEPDEFSDDGFEIEAYRSRDGDYHVGVVVSKTERDCFLTVPEKGSVSWPEGGGVHSFTNLFGCDGKVISYNGWLDERYYGKFKDYYTFSNDGTPSLLLRAKGETVSADLDGDGMIELTASGGESSELFFRRDGQIYRAELKSLIQSAWDGAGYMEFGFWDSNTRCVPLSAEVPVPGSDYQTATAFRTLWFDGNNLRLYKDTGLYSDHVKTDIDAPADVLAAARDFVEAQFQSLAAEGYGTDGSGNYGEENFGPGNVVWDDWRITGLNGPGYETAGGLRVEVWNVSYETHTTTPERVMLAGGSYLGEDGWCMIGYPGCDYLYFLLDENDDRTYLYSAMENDCGPGTEVFLSDMVGALMARGLLKLSDLGGAELAKMMWPQSADFLNRLAEWSAADRDAALETLGVYLAQTADGRTYYDGFAAELDEGGYRSEDLTNGGWIAWGILKGTVIGSERRDAMPLSELLKYAAASDGAYAESAFTQLHQRFLADPEAVLTALAEMDNHSEQSQVSTALGYTIARDEDLFPGAIEKARSLNLKGEPAAMLEYVTAAYEARRETA